MLHLLDSGEGLNDLAEWKTFHNGMWYLLLGFNTTIEPVVCDVWWKGGLRTQADFHRALGLNLFSN